MKHTSTVTNIEPEVFLNFIETDYWKRVDSLKQRKLFLKLRFMREIIRCRACTIYDKKITVKLFNLTAPPKDEQVQRNLYVSFLYKGYRGFWKSIKIGLTEEEAVKLRATGYISTILTFNDNECPPFLSDDEHKEQINGVY